MFKYIPFYSYETFRKNEVGTIDLDKINKYIQTKLCYNSQMVGKEHKVSEDIYNIRKIMEYAGYPEDFELTYITVCITTVLPVIPEEKQCKRLAAIKNKETGEEIFKEITETYTTGITSNTKCNNCIEYLLVKHDENGGKTGVYVLICNNKLRKTDLDIRELYPIGYERYSGNTPILRKEDNFDSEMIGDMIYKDKFYGMV